jgi:hypothetical protein
MTNVAIMIHPDCHEGHPAKLTGQQENALRNTLRFLDQFIRGKRIAVLSSPATTAVGYSQVIAEHYDVDPFVCEGLLRHFPTCDVKETCDCVEDFFDPLVGFTFALVSEDIAKPLTELLATHVHRPYGELVVSDNHFYLV